MKAVIYSRKARNDLKAVPAADREAIYAKFARFAADGTGDVKKLVGRPGYRLRHRDWRATFTIEDDILVVRVLHRHEAYR